MKKMRWLASVLCVMMVVCALPVMQASAAVGDVDDAIATIMGVDSAINVYEVQNGAEGPSVMEDVNALSQANTYTDDGVQLDASGTSWLLSNDTDDAFWNKTTAVVLKLKVGSGDRLRIYTEAGTRANTGTSSSPQSRTNILLADGNVYYNVVGNQTGTIGGNTFQTGTDWFELMVLHKESTVDLYVKNSETGNAWTKLEFESDLLYQQGHAGPTDKAHHFYISRESAAAAEAVSYLKSVSVFQEDARITTIEEALNSYLSTLSNENAATVAMTASSNAWNFANSTMTTYTRSGYTSIITPSGARFTDEGMNLSGTNGIDEWTFSAFSGWAPAYYSSSNGFFRAAYAKVKGDVTISTLTKGSAAIDKLRSVPDKTLAEANALALDGTTAAYRTSGGFSANPTIDDNWIEYLIVPRNTNACYVFAKSDTLTNGEWVKAIGIDRYSWSGDTNGTESSVNNQKGISFNGTGVVAEWKTIDFNNASRTTVVTEDETKPAAATVAWLEEEFDNTSTYEPQPTLGTASTVANGVMSTNARYANTSEGVEATSGHVHFYDYYIPVGGYAEFRMRGNGLKRLVFDDGATKWETALNCDYSAMPGTAAQGGGYLADSDMSWRAWRLVRTADGYNVYTKADGDTGWRVHCTNGAGTESSGNDPRITIEFYPNADGINEGNGQLDYMRVYGTEPFDPDGGDDDQGGSGEGGTGGDTPGDSTIDTIAEVLQKSVATSSAEQSESVVKVKTDDLYATSHDWNFANSAMETYSRSGNGSLALPEGAELTEEGLDLSGTAGVGKWRYHPHTSWAFVNAAGGSNTVLRAGYVKVKGDVTISFTGSEHKRLINVYSKPNVATTSGYNEKATAFVPDTDWVEYIFFPSNSNSVRIWAKKATDTVWVDYGISGTTVSESDATANKGLHFSGTGVVAGWKTIEVNENGYKASSYPDVKLIATDAETNPANADTLWFGEEFDQEINYVPAPVLGAASKVEGGILNNQATIKDDAAGTENASAEFTLNDVIIPVGGYAEFRAKGDGAIEAMFDDGTNMFKMHRYPADNYSIQGTAITTFANFVNDSDMAWRTYRVVRSAEGYSFYSKADGDTGWRIMGTAAEASKTASDGKGARIYFRFHTNCDGKTMGSGQLDYLRIYGAAPEDGIAVTDGNTAVPVADGATLKNPEYLHVVLDGDITSGKVIVANYKGKILKKMQVVDVSELTAGTFVNAKDGFNTNVKVFLWDSLEGNSKALAEALSLNYRN